MAFHATVSTVPGGVSGEFDRIRASELFTWSSLLCRFRSSMPSLVIVIARIRDSGPIVLHAVSGE